MDTFVRYLLGTVTLRHEDFSSPHKIMCLPAAQRSSQVHTSAGEQWFGSILKSLAISRILRLSATLPSPEVIADINIMATGYATFLGDSKNVNTDKILLNLSPSNNEFIFQLGAVSNDQPNKGFMQVLTKHGAACFTNDVKNGCQDFAQRGSSCTDEVGEVTAHYWTIAQQVHEKVTPKAIAAKKHLVTGGKWLTGKMKTAFDFVMEKTATPAKEELNEARLNEFADQRNKNIKKEKGNGNDTVDTEEDSS